MSERRVIAGLHGLALLLLGLRLYVWTLPPTPTAIPAQEDLETAWWGLWPVTYLPLWALILGSAAVMASLAWSWRRMGQLRGSPAAAGDVGQKWLMAASLLLFAAFWLLPIVHTRWGDAYILANAIAWPDPDFRLTHSWQAPLDVFLHSQVWLWLHEPLGWADAAPVYRILSPLAGALYLLALLGLSRERSLGPDWLIFTVVASLGVTQLFFGYIENYSFAAAGILAYLWLGIGVVQARRPLWLAATVLAVTNATHPSTVVYAPSLLYLGWLHIRRAQEEAGGRLIPGVVGSPLLQIALPMILVAGATILLMESGGHGVREMVNGDRPGGGDGRWFVPVFAIETRWERYTMLSWPHIQDILNQQLLTAPIVLPSILLLWLGTLGRTRRSHTSKTARQRSRRSQPQTLDAPRTTHHIATGRFLLLAALFHLLLIWTWNPDYGGQRDWDLFCMAAIPAALLLLWQAQHWLKRGRVDGRLLLPAFLPLLLLQGLHLATWIYQNRLPWDWP